MCLPFIELMSDLHLNDDFYLKMLQKKDSCDF